MVTPAEFKSAIECDRILFLFPAIVFVLAVAIIFLSVEIMPVLHVPSVPVVRLFPTYSVQNGPAGCG